MLAATSHDLRQPIHAQALYLELLKQDLNGRQEEELVDRIMEAGHAINDMLDALLEISRLDAGGLQPVISKFALQPLLLRLEREFMPLAHNKGLRFKLYSNTSWCLSDPQLLERILRNLLTNALLYTNRGGVVIGCRQRGDLLWIQVWDTGIGIPIEQQQNIFREFQQLANPERDRRKGLGLGLAIVQRLSKLLNHPLQMASRPGKGSLFELGLPKVTVAQPVVPETYFPPMDIPAGLTVLVLDDDPMVLDAIGRIPVRFGCRALCISILDEAEDLLTDETKPDVLLEDYRLTDKVNGISAARHIHQLLGYKLPTAIISGDIDLMQQPEVANSGFPVLAKPLDAARLRALLSSLSRETVLTVLA